MVKFMGKALSFSKRKVSLSESLQRGILGLILVVTISFLISTYFIVEREQRSYAISEAESITKTLSSNINADITKYMEMSRIIMTEDRLVKFLRAKGESVDIGMINDARYGIMDVLNVTEGVDCVMVIREDLIMATTNRFTYRIDYDRLVGDEWKKEICDAKGKTVVSLNSNGIAIKNDNRSFVTIGRAIYDIDSQVQRGIMLMNISTGIFDRMLNSLGYRNICIMGDDGTFLAGNSKYAYLFDSSFDSGKIKYKDVTIDGERMLLSGCRVGEYPIVLLRVAPFSAEGIPFTMLYVLLILLLIFMLMAVVVGNFIRKNITDPVLKLSASMDENKCSGNLKRIDVDMPSTELELLKGDYNSLIDHVNELITTLIDKEKNLQKAEMRVLQEQIKPHFLYNSIETIGFLAMDAGADKVHDALETLGSFYRNFLSKGDREIPLSREICIVKDYLSLQKLRYGEIINDEYDIAEDTLNVVVPKLILQPLVENSIYHGIRQKGEEGTIKISSFIEDGYLHLAVRDTGVGMSQEEIDRILSTEDATGRSEEESFGLWGTIHRIRIFEGKDDIVKIESEIGEYTQVEFIISIGEKRWIENSGL